MADTKGDDRRDVPFTAPWAQNLAHRREPNHVRRFSPTDMAPRPVAAGAGGADYLQSPPQSEPSYYDVPMLKRPLWRWEIATYFFLGGMSAGAHILSRLADRYGADEEPHRDLTRIGTYLALGAFIPCPPLLIHDLGDPRRFHHMLRVWKPSTPMNFGTWSIVGYSGMAAAAALREYLRDKKWPQGTPPTPLLRAADKALLLVHDAAGIPFAILVAGYTGVLLSCTSNPLWSKNPWIGPLFSASAISTGAEAISLALDIAGKDNDASQSTLRKVDTAAHVIELLCMRGFFKFAGEKARPLHTGSMRKHNRISHSAMIAAEALKLVPAGEKLRKPLRILSSLLGLAAGFSLRWAMVHGGREAAADPHLCRVATGPQENTQSAVDGMERAAGRLPGASSRAPVSPRPATSMLAGQPVSPPRPA